LKGSKCARQGAMGGARMIMKGRGQVKRTLGI
jgi:hypothetical protein